MKSEEIRKLGVEELKNKINSAKQELFELRLKQATGSLDKPSKIKELRKGVARMLTILKEKEGNSNE